MHECRTVIQSEISHKEKNYHILAHIYIERIYKNGPGGPICRAGIDADVEDALVDTAGLKERVGQIERAALTYTH